MRLIKNSIVIKGIIIFLCFGMIHNGFELYASEVDYNVKLNELVKKYNKEEYDEVIEKLEHLLNEVGEDQGQIRGKFFLLLGASYEKKGNKDKAVENYLLGDILLGKSELKGIDLKSLKIFNNTIYGKVVNGQRVYEKVGKRKRKKRFPYLAILGVAALVTAVVLLSKKKESNNEDEELKALKAQQVFSQFEWIEIPAGEFIMGTAIGTGDPDESPAHAVYLDSYKISKYEITIEQYRKFSSGSLELEVPDDEVIRKHPVSNVNPDNAITFCEWIRQYTDNSVYLPTEAQWEKAARGTDQRIYPWGNNTPDCSITNYNNCIGATIPVGSNPDDRSFYGVMDMGGNVSEYVRDVYSDSYYSESPYSNPTGPVTILVSNRVMRGGNYESSVQRITNRERVARYTKNPIGGFRVVWQD